MHTCMCVFHGACACDTFMLCVLMSVYEDKHVESTQIPNRCFMAFRDGRKDPRDAEHRQTRTRVQHAMLVFTCVQICSCAYMCSLKHIG